MPALRAGAPEQRPPAAGGAGLPQAFLERLQRILPPEAFERALHALHAPPPVALRANTLRITPAALAGRLRDAGLTPSALPWEPDALLLPAAQRAALTHGPLARQGLFWIQNPSSMLPPRALAPQPGEAVLDLAAAPGGKTLHMACLMQGRGRLSAVEPVRERYHRLRANLAAQGADWVRTYRRDGRGVWRSCPERFDRVLLDAPCSTEARMRPHDPASFAHWSPAKIREAARKQGRLLYSAFQSLKPGGVLVYSTCSYAPEENEAVVSRLLRRFPDAAAVEEADLPVDNCMPGLRGWEGKPFDPRLEAASRILPDGLMEGFFLCRIRKLRSTLDGAAPPPARPGPGRSEPRRRRRRGR